MDTQRLKELLLEKGATFVGFSDIRNIENNLRFSGAITIGIKLLDAVIEQVYRAQKPTYQYFHHYRTVNFALDQLALFAALRLEKEGHKVLMIPASQSSVEDPYAGAFPHKTAAVKANLGYIGKSALFLHKDYGSMVRLATVLIEEPLQPDLPPVTLSCGTCDRCVKACPAQAITGKEYVPGEKRESVFDAEKCSRHMKNAYRHIGRGAVCGVCISVCPRNRIGN